MNQRKTILAVDDVKSNIEILVELLSEKYDVMAALDAKTAIEIVDDSMPDLILLDIMMPEMDGYEMCQILKKNKKTKAIPIIFLTAKTDEDSIEKAYNFGGADYVSKPFQPKELHSRVQTQLKIVDLITNLEETVQVEVDKRVEQEKVLLHQSRLASMGEMIDVIAHQWMQPISIMNAQIALLDIDVQFKQIDETYVDNLQNKFTLQIRHLTNTLKEFRNFFRPSYKTTYFDTQEMLQKAVHLIEDEFRLQEVLLEINVDDTFKLHGIENEFIHLVLNILNNSRNVLQQKNIENKKIIINIFTDKVYNNVEIIDNAGGISDTIIDDIFKMNVTNKESKNGTGIGLYISHLIAKKHNATLEAINVDSGAKFTLKQKKDN